METDRVRQRELLVHARTEARQVAAVLRAEGKLDARTSAELVDSQKLASAKRSTPREIHDATVRIQVITERMRESARENAVGLPAPYAMPFTETVVRRGRGRVPLNEPLRFNALPISQAKVPAGAFGGDGELSVAAREILLVSSDPVASDEAAQRNAVITHMSLGATAREAIAELGLSIHPKTAKRWHRQHLKHGQLVDRRRTRVVAPTKMDPEFQELTFDHWVSNIAATVRQTHQMLVKLVYYRNEGKPEEKHQKAPCLSTVQRYIRRLPRSLHDYRRNPKTWTKRLRLFEERDLTTFANEMWEIDAKLLDMRVQIYNEATKEWEESDVYIIAIIDVFSRAIMGWTLSLWTPDADMTLLALRNAILRSGDGISPLRGLPVFLRCDHGKEFKNQQIVRILLLLGIEMALSVPHYPNSKPFIEAFYRTVKHRLSDQPGVMLAERGVTARARKMLAGKLQFPALWQVIAEEVDAYNRTVHSETQQAPIERWSAFARIRERNADETAVLLSQVGETVVVQGSQIEFRKENGGGVYQHAALLQYHHHEVVARCCEEDLRTIWVFSFPRGEFICRASETSLVTEDLRKEANQASLAVLRAAVSDPAKAARRQDAIKARDVAVREGQPPLVDENGRFLASRTSSSAAESGLERHPNRTSPTLRITRFRDAEQKAGRTLLQGTPPERNDAQEHRIGTRVPKERAV